MEGETELQNYSKPGALHQHIEELEQVGETFPWESLSSKSFLSCFRFVTQLVLVGCCGSFLFGFNVSLLNTAVGNISSEFQLCGYPSGFASHLYDVSRTPNGIQAARELCSRYPQDCTASKCVENSSTNYYKCQGGYTDSSCSQMKWYGAFLSAAVLIGGIIGAMAAGQFVSRGRRTLFLGTITTFTIGIICSLCANSFPAMFCARFIVGIGVGMVSVGSPTYISEMTPRLERGKFGVFHQLTITIGLFIGILLGLALPDPSIQDGHWQPDAFSMFWWRFMLGLGLIPVILSAYVLLKVYPFDTPIYYVEQGKHQDAYKLLQKIHAKTDIDDEFEVCVEHVRIGKEFKKKGLTLSSAVSQAEYRTVILVGIFLAGFQQFGGINVFMTSSTEIFKRAGLTREMQTAMSIIMSLINVIMTFPTIVLIEKMGRKSLLFCGSLLQTILVLPCAISYWTEANPDDPSQITQVLAIIAVIGFVTFFAVAFGPVVWVYLFEIYPMEIKDAASSVATAVNWISGVIMVVLSNVIPNQISFTIFCILQLLATLFILFCMKETKGLPLGTTPYIKKTQKVESTV